MNQKNLYLGRTPRPWLAVPFRNSEFVVHTVKLIADTGCPQSVILAPEWFDSLVTSRFASIRANFGEMDGGWLQIFDPDSGFVELVRGYSSAKVGGIAFADHPDFAGIVGLPILRLGEYGGDASDFWFRYPELKPHMAPP